MKALLRISILFMLMVSCMKTEMVGEVILEQVDTMSKKPQKPLPPPLPPRDTTEVDDTSRVSMGWNPTVEDWEEQDINL